jgi:hypothetical protein
MKVLSGLMLYAPLSGAGDQLSLPPASIAVSSPKTVLPVVQMPLGLLTIGVIGCSGLLLVDYAGRVCVYCSDPLGMDIK